MRRAAPSVVGHEQVVLTEHALGEVAEQPAHLGGRDAPAHRRERVVREARAEPLHERIEQRPHRRDVRLDPVAPVEHARRRVPGRAQPGVARDEILGADGQRVEVGLQRRGEIRVGERIAAGDEAGDAPGRGPVDGIGRPPFDRRRGRSLAAGDPSVSSRPTLTQYPTAELDHHGEEADREQRGDPVEPELAAAVVGEHVDAEHQADEPEGDPR